MSVSKELVLNARRADRERLRFIQTYIIINKMVTELGYVLWDCIDTFVEKHFSQRSTNAKDLMIFIPTRWWMLLSALCPGRHAWSRRVISRNTADKLSATVLTPLITSSQHYNNIIITLDNPWRTIHLPVWCHVVGSQGHLQSNPSHYPMSLSHVIIPLIAFPLWNGDSGSGRGSWCIVGMTTMLEKRRGESLVVVAAAAVVWMMEPLHSSESWQISLLVLSRSLSFSTLMSLSFSTLVMRGFLTRMKALDPPH